MRDTEAIDCAVEPFHLLRGLSAERCIGENFRRGEVGECAIKFEMRTFGHLPREAIDILRRNSESIHAGVQLQLNRHVFLPKLRGGRFEHGQLFAAVDRWG